MNKGDIVKIKATVTGSSNGSTRKLVKHKKFDSKMGIVLGYTFIYTGRIESGWDNEPGYLAVGKSHKVVAIEPLECGNRYLEPVRCLEDDLELVE